jgi:hypothetical protein
MKRQKLEIATPARIEVEWYDKVCSSPADKKYDGEVIGWRNSQVIVRVAEYGVLRFWKASGLEVGNGDSERRGFRIDLDGFVESTKPAPGITVAVDLSSLEASS